MTNEQTILLIVLLALAVWGLSELFNFIAEKIDEWIKKKKANKLTKKTNTHE